MICTACQTPNEADARFCEGCGSAMERRCAGCGTPASATARFCKSCGGSLASPVQPAPAAPTRKTVTVLFADLAGSTTFEEKVDAETAREVLGRYHTLLARSAHRHRAGVTKYIGDGFMAVWGVPEISADDADHAVDAAVELQERFVDLAAEVANTYGETLALRVAVNTGEVVVGSDDADLVGDALNVAARLESQCPHGQVVVGEETWRSTRGRYRYEPLSPVQVRGRVAPVAVYQWAGRRSEPIDSMPFVGRAHEFRRLTAVLDEAVARRGARLVTVMGDPGVGKTRLASEFAASQQDAVVLQIRCAADGTVALAPVVEVLRTRDIEADLPAAVPERDRIVRDLTGMAGGVAGSVEETFWALRRYFEVLAERGLLILVLDDVQWADALLLDFVEHLSEWVREAPVLMIALGRPELRESRPELVTVGGWVGDAIRLGGLEPGATAELAARVLGTDQLPTELLARLPSSTGGNPLFVRELVAMLVHDGVLVAEADGWRLTIDVDAIAVPPTIQALLASRLERMNTADRRVLETASVIGTDFSPAAVCALSGASPAEVKTSLDRLRRLELAQPSGAYIGDEPVWRFHHILIRDVAYRRLLKSDRAELHERFADWVRDGGRAGVFESDELLARHLESAYGYRCELGVRDSATADLAVRSAQCYLSAARRALDRDALVSAGAQAARGAALAADPALRAELLLVGCEAYLSAGDVAAGAPLVDELDRIEDAALAPWATCYRCQYIVYTDPSRLPEVDERLQEAIDEFARRGDPAGTAKAYRVRANARGRLGRIGEAEADLFEALVAARQCGDHRQITAALGAAPNAALWGPSPAPKAGGRCLDVVRMQRMTTAAPSLEATSLRCLAVLELLRGRPDKARSMLGDARQIVSDLGLRHGLMETELYAGIIESMVGDPVAAEPYFRTALQGLDSLGVGADAGQAAALLARSLLAQGRVDEADRYAAESERIAGHNLKTAIGWRAARAEILSAQGRHREAVAMARDAVSVAAGTDLVLDYADACLTLSRVLADSGDARGAADARLKAESLYAAKDAVFLVGVASQPAVPVVDELEPESVPRLRLSTENRASDVPLKTWQGTVRISAGFVYEDRRHVSGEPLENVPDLHAAAKRKIEQYPHVEAPVLAARGEGLALVSLHWWDDAGNQSTSLDVYEVNSADELAYHGRFDEGDFACAYRVLEERYYAGEGSAFAAGGLAQLGFQLAIWTQDAEAARSLVQPDFVWIADPSTLKPGERSLDEIFTWRAERLGQVGSFEDWPAALEWLSPEVCVLRVEMKGEDYRWPRIYVTNFHHGVLVSGREFDIDDEETAFAYAESLLARARSRLVVRNRASMVADGLFAALRAKDLSGAPSYAERLVYDDRRRIPGNPMTCREDVLGAAQLAVRQYSDFEHETLAVRGERSVLVSSRWSDPAGKETGHMHVFVLDDDGLIGYEGRFDEDDFLSAYVELDRRYYAGEGAEFADGGRANSGWVEGIGRRDIEMVRRFSTPDFCWFAPPSSLKAAERTVEDMFDWLRGRGERVSSQRHWQSVIEWVTPGCAVGLTEVTAVEPDGDEYRWTYIVVTEVHDGRAACVREFDTEDEAFAYAESVAKRRPSRLAVTNRASAVGQRLIGCVHSGDVEAATNCYADHVRYDDRRQINGEPITGRAAIRAAIERLTEQFQQFEFHTLAVRGQRLHLARTRWSDAAGNESIGLVLAEVDDDGLIVYDGRFDEDDFESAYLEMERRYFADEGEAHADAGAALMQVFLAETRGDLDSAFAMFAAPGLRIESRSRSVFPGRSAVELRRSVEELGAMVGSYRVWSPAGCWLSPEWVVARHQREAIGSGGDALSWSRIYVIEIRDGLAQSVCEFDADDEEQAFAYAEERMRARPSRLAIANRASEIGARMVDALRAGDVERALEMFPVDAEYGDFRRVSGDPIVGKAARRQAIQRSLQQFNRLALTIIAIRGENLALARSSRSDDTGNESTALVLGQIDDDGNVVALLTFDDDDFENAYQEMERRYYGGEGAPFAQAGAVMSKLVAAGNRGDNDAVFALFEPGMRVESRSRTIIPSRALDELRSSVDEFKAMVRSSRIWCAAVRWLSPTCAVVRHEREAVGHEGQSYEWSRIYALEIHGGRFTGGCEFDIEFEDEAFAYAEERLRASGSRLAVTNRASVVAERLAKAIRRDSDLETALAQFASDCVYEDRRRLSGDPIVGVFARRAALERIVQQYGHLTMSPVAVRGDRLVLERCCRYDDSGNESIVLVLGEINCEDHVGAYISFDEDDFEGAYQELERRHYAGEGAASAAGGRKLADFVAALNRGDLDSAFTVIGNPDLRIETRSRAVFPDRSIAELREGLEELLSLTASARWSYSSLRWLSPNVCVGRLEREAVGPEGQSYAWTDIYAFEFRGDAVTWICRYDLDDEDRAFADAGARMLLSPSRLAVANRASAVRVAGTVALQRGEIDTAAGFFADNVVLEDRRRMSGEPPASGLGIRSALTKLRNDYSHFDGQFLAVRGDRLVLARYVCSDAAGNQTSGLSLTETGADGLITSEVRYDEDDFEAAYHELDRRYFAGEGAAYVDIAPVQAGFVDAANHGDLDAAKRVCLPSFRVISPPTTLAAEERSLAEFIRWVADRIEQVPSVRHWMSTMNWVSTSCVVGRLEIQAIGSDVDGYSWPRIAVVEIRGGRFAHIRQFDVDDEDSAFAYADEIVAKHATRLPSTNIASEVGEAAFRLMNSRDLDVVVDFYADDFVFNDHRRLSGDPICKKSDMRAAFERILSQFTTFELRGLAVRGNRLALGWSRWSDGAGNESRHLHLVEVDSDGRIIYDGRFDEEDFEGAYAELERRYYAGEGAAFAENGLASANYMAVLNRGEWDVVFGSLTQPAITVENRSRSAFPHRTIDELRRSFEDLHSMVSSVRTWFSAITWVSQETSIARMEREAVGPDGEEFAWTHMLVTGWRQGKLAAICEFDADGGDAAFAYAARID